MSIKHFTCTVGNRKYPVTYVRPDISELMLCILNLEKTYADDEFIGIDIETYGKEEYVGTTGAGLLAAKSRIRTIQLYGGNNAIVLDIGDPCFGEYLFADKRLAKPLFKFLQSKKLVAHNAIFETCHLQRVAESHDILEPLNIYCTMNAFRLVVYATEINPLRFKASLANVAKLVLDIDVPKDEQTSDWSAPGELSESQIYYCARDAILPVLLLEVLSENLEELGMLDVYKLNTQAQEVVAHMNNGGIPIDLDAHTELTASWKEKLELHERECFLLLNEGKGSITSSELKDILTQKIVAGWVDVVWDECIFSDNRPRITQFPEEAKRFFQLSADFEARAEEETDAKAAKENKAIARACKRFAKNIEGYLVNPNSGLQLSNWLKLNVNTNGWPISEKSGHLKTDHHTFLESPDSEKIAPIIEYKKYEKLYSTYGVGLLDHMVEDADGVVRIHPNFTLCYTETGRMSSFEPNLQNAVSTRRDEGFRKIFVSSSDNHRLLVADFSQIEIRTFAHISGDSTMLQVYGMGGDIHTATAEAISGRRESTFTKEEWAVKRFHAKAINFCVLFGGGAATICKYAKRTYGVDMEEDEAAEYLENFRQTYHEGRQWQLDHTRACEHSLEVRTPLGKLRRLDPETYYTVCLNTPVQGGAAEIMLKAMVNLWDSIRKSGISARILNIVHDEVIVDCHVDHVEIMKSYIKVAMCSAMAFIFPDATVEGLVDVGVGNNWAEAKGK